MPITKNLLRALRFSKSSRNITSVALLAGLLATAQGSVAGENQSSSDDGPKYAIGLNLGTFGIGVSANVKTNWSLVAGDQIQWRTAISGINADDSGDEEFNGIDYKDIDLSLFAIKTGVDWYPYQEGWADEIFFSAGMAYENSDFSGSANTDKSLNVGGVTVNPGDIDSLDTDIEYSGVLPYLSVGWGNKLTGKKGWDFQAEIGVLYRVSDANVSVRASDPSGFLTAEDLAAEEREIEDEFGDIQAFAAVTLSYLF